MAPVWDETLGCQILVSKLILGGSKGYLSVMGGSHHWLGEGREGRRRGRHLGGWLRHDVGRNKKGKDARGRQFDVDEEFPAVVWSSGRPGDLVGRGRGCSKGWREALSV